MKLSVKMKLNSVTEISTEFEAPDLQEVIRNAGVLLDFNGKCGMCNGYEEGPQKGLHDITVTTRRTKPNPDGKSYTYTEFVCRVCGARRPFGKYQDGSGFFLKPWEEKYEGDK